MTRLFATTIILFLAGMAPATTFAQDVEGPTVDEKVLEEFQESGTAGYLIAFREESDLAPAYTMDWNERGRFVVETLRRAAESAQPRVRAYLRDARTPFKSFWIDNVIVVESSDFATFDGLTQFREIAELRTLEEMQLMEPEKAERTSSGPSSLFTVEPNIDHVNAPDVWDLGFEGEGMVVGGIDTGVRYTHEALVGQYRGNQGGGVFDHNHNWWDPGVGTTAPTDWHSHGTHTMGTAVGDDGGPNQIGVAPGAEWIACRGCPGQSCPAAALLSCAQFMAAPWDLDEQNADPDLRPHVVNNSWGSCQQSYDDWYQGVVDAWHAAGIVPVFSNGNNSNCGYPVDPPCNTVGNPGRYANVLGVGSTGTNNGQYAPHSNKGPTDDPWDDNPLGFPTIKPNTAAPGVTIRSAVNTGDAAYQSSGWTGTSMSAPHVAGLVALLWEAAPCLIGDYVTTAQVIMEYASPIPVETACGGEGPGNVPNHATGWGEIDALESALGGFDACVQLGTVAGTVTRSDSSAPVEDVEVRTIGVLADTATTGSGGSYQLELLEGTYNVTATREGFRPATETDVSVPGGTTTPLDFTLEPIPISAVAPPGFVLETSDDPSIIDTLTIGNTGQAPLTWSLATDLSEGVAGTRSRNASSGEPLDVPDFEVISFPNGGEAVVFEAQAGVASRGDVFGVGFTGTAEGISGTSTWASDTCMLLEAPDGTTFAVGGNNGAVPGCGPESDAPWDFQGNGSTEDGAYESGYDDAFDPPVDDLGTWTMTFVHDWNSVWAVPISWSDVTVTLHKTAIPLCDDVSEVPWLSVAPEEGEAGPGTSTPVTVTVDAAGLEAGTHVAGLCLETNDPEAALVAIPVTVIADGGTVAGETAPEEITEGLSQPTPNPSSKTSMFTVAVTKSQNVTVEVFDTTGRRVQRLYDGALPAGTSETLLLDTAALPAGVYIVRAVGETFAETRRLTVVQ